MHGPFRWRATTAGNPNAAADTASARLTDPGVPAVVDFLDSGYGCDPARSTGWVEEPGEELFTWAPQAPGDDPRLVLDTDELAPGRTAEFEFHVDESGDRVAASVKLRLSGARPRSDAPVILRTQFVGRVGRCRHRRLRPAPSWCVTPNVCGRAGGR